MYGVEQVVVKKAFGLGARAAVAAAAVYAVVAPRRADEHLARIWEEIKGHRFAHRGLHNAEAPENSLAAFARAVTHGFGVELDVHLSADGVPVVMHDAQTGRMCEKDVALATTPAHELGQLHLAGTDQTIPTLDQALRVLDEGSAPLIVELKPTAPSMVAQLCEKTLELLDRLRVTFCVESFDPRVLSWLREHRPDVLRGLLVENYLRRATEGVGMVERLAGTLLVGNAVARPDFVACRFEDRHIPSVRLVCGALGAHLVTWTTHTERDLLISEAEGAPSIFEGFIPAARFSLVATS